MRDGGYDVKPGWELRVLTACLLVTPHRRKGASCTPTPGDVLLKAAPCISASGQRPHQGQPALELLCTQSAIWSVLGPWTVCSRHHQLHKHQSNGQSTRHRCSTRSQTAMAPRLMLATPQTRNYDHGELIHCVLAWLQECLKMAIVQGHGISPCDCHATFAIISSCWSA